MLSSLSSVVVICRRRFVLIVVYAFDLKRALRASKVLAPPARDRNVSDPRDYKLAELGPTPSVAHWKKWRRDLESFVDMIGLSWSGDGTST